MELGHRYYAYFQLKSSARKKKTNKKPQSFVQQGKISIPLHNLQSELGFIRHQRENHCNAAHVQCPCQCSLHACYRCGAENHQQPPRWTTKFIFQFLICWLSQIWLLCSQRLFNKWFLLGHPLCRNTLHGLASKLLKKKKNHKTPKQYLSDFSGRWLGPASMNAFGV